MLQFDHAIHFLAKKEQHVFRRICFFAGDGSPAYAHLQKMRQALRRHPLRLSQFLCMAFGQLTHSLRDIEICLHTQKSKLYHTGIRGGVSRNTLSNANKMLDWRIYADFAHDLIKIARPLYATEDLGLEMENTIYALDASTVNLCLSVFPWALFRSTNSAVTLHTLQDLHGNIPTFMHISDGKLHDVNALDLLVPKQGHFILWIEATWILRVSTSYTLLELFL